MSDKKILEFSLKKLTEEFDNLISDCTTSTGEPAKPSIQSIMKVRACLPNGYKNSFKKKEK